MPLFTIFLLIPCSVILPPFHLSPQVSGKVGMDPSAAPFCPMARSKEEERREKRKEEEEEWCIVGRSDSDSGGSGAYSERGGGRGYSGRGGSEGRGGGSECSESSGGSSSRGEGKSCEDISGRAVEGSRRLT